HRHIPIGWVQPDRPNWSGPRSLGRDDDLTMTAGSLHARDAVTTEDLHMPLHRLRTVSVVPSSRRPVASSP
ncbi:MAG: hypothetical protein ABI137_06015, partial [Antricoccus sp.]